MRNKNPTLGPSGTQMKREAELLVATGLFPESAETFRACFGCNNSLIYLCITEVLSYQSSQSLLQYIKNMLKGQPFKTSGLQFDN